MFFNPIKEINRLTSKRMSNIYLKGAIDENWRSQNLDFLSLKKLSQGQFLGSSNSRRYQWILKLLVWTWNSDIRQQKRVWLFYYFNFERNYDVFKSKSLCILLNKNKNFNEIETESKMENPTHSFKERNVVLQLL